MSGVKGVRASGNGWRAECRVDGKKELGKTRATITEAEADYAELKRQQEEGDLERKRNRSNAAQAERAAHVEHLAANFATFGGCRAKEGLSRALVKMALRDSTTIGVADGVEYSIDLHTFRKNEARGFDPTVDAELHPDVPTLALELKMTQHEIPHHGKMDNPRFQFAEIHYGGNEAMLVIMIYVPEEYTEPTDAAFKDAVFWWKIAKKFTPAHGIHKCSKFAKHEADNPKPLCRLKKVIEEYIARHPSLIPYGERARKFKQETHRIGQRAIDCVEDQVLRPIGAKFAPTASGCEGDAEDRVLILKDGSRLSCQIKKVCIDNGQFKSHLARHDGSIRQQDGSMKYLMRPYSVDDNVDCFLFVALDAEETLIEYWYSTSAQMLGDQAVDRLITDSDGNPGVKKITLYPHAADAARLDVRTEEATSRNRKYKDRTRQWIQTLGPILDPRAAHALKLKEYADRAEAAAVRAEAAAARAEAAPQTVNNITNNNTLNINYHVPTDEVSKRQRIEGDIRGFFAK